MNEIFFLVEQAPEGGYAARALDASISTEADDIESLHLQVRDEAASATGLLKSLPSAVLSSFLNRRKRVKP